jgi:hypothetical protein
MLHSASTSPPEKPRPQSGDVKSQGHIAMKNFKDLKQEWLKDPEVNQAYLDMKPEFELASTLIAARARARLAPSSDSIMDHCSVA